MINAVWKAWELRSLILISLSFQILLILVGPFRKRTSNGIVTACIWATYLLADYLAYQAVSIIPNSKHLTHPDLLAFWAPFLLVHLGGPDTITAIALEDNELWMRTALHLGAQVLATSRVMFLSLPDNRLLLPTLLMFLAGLLKYTERICSLFLARTASLTSSLVEDPDLGPDYAAVMEVYDSYLLSELPATLAVTPPSETPILDAWVRRSEQGFYADPQPAAGLGKVQLLRDAHRFFQMFRFVYVDLVFGMDDWEESRPYFRRIKPQDAMSILEAELNFAYENFFTKMVLFRRSIWGGIRHVSTVCQVVSLVIWAGLVDKQHYRGFDIGVTYTLLCGAVFLHALSYIRTALSDYKIATVPAYFEKMTNFYEKLLSVRHNRTWGGFWTTKESSCGPRLRRLLFRRWSESLSQFNLINYCANSWSDTAKLFLRSRWVKDKCDGMVYVSALWFPDELRDFIFLEIMHKSDMIIDLKVVDDMCDSKGEWVFRLLAGSGFDPSIFHNWTKGVQFDECLLLWHVATELLYQLQDVDDYRATDSHHREYSKTLSDYMMYLLVWQSKLMLPVAGIGEVRFRYTCAEATNFLARVLPRPLRMPDQTKETRLKEACRKIMDVNTKLSPKVLKGDKYKSVLFEAVCLAKTLRTLKQNTDEDGVGMWEVMAKVWVELLCYSAVRCRPNEHAAQLKQGGQLITIVWLLMVHLGLGKHFRVTQNTSTSKILRRV